MNIAIFCGTRTQFHGLHYTGNKFLNVPFLIPLVRVHLGLRIKFINTAELYPDIRCNHTILRTQIIEVETPNLLFCATFYFLPSFLLLCAITGSWTGQSLRNV